MDDDKQDKPGASFTGETGKRAPPTIDLTASDVSDTAPASDATAPDDNASASAHSESSAHSSATPEHESVSPSRASSLVLSAVTGAVAALVVIGGAKLAGWPAAPAPVLTDTANKSDVDALGARLAKVESDAAKPVAPASPVADPAVTARIGALEKSLTSLRDDIAAVRGQSDKAIAALSDIKSSPPQALAETEPQAAPAVDTSAIEDRLGKIERATAALSATVAAPPVPQPPADDPKLRKVAAATLLDSAVRQGEPYAAALSLARASADDAAVLKPLDAFAASGVPGANALCRELLALLPQLAPKQDTSAAPSGIVERLQQSATKLVRIQRTDVAAAGNGGVLARVAAAAERDDVGEAKRELNALPATERAPAQPWIAKADAREAALAASRQFASDAMTVLSKPVLSKPAQ